MEDKEALTIEQVQEELKRFPASVSDEFDSAIKLMPETMNDAQLTAWAQSGLEIAQQTVRSWEAAAQFFKVSPKVIGFMPFNYFVRWNECGSELCAWVYRSRLGRPEREARSYSAARCHRDPWR